MKMETWAKADSLFSDIVGIDASLKTLSKHNVMSALKHLPDEEQIATNFISIITKRLEDQKVILQKQFEEL